MGTTGFRSRPSAIVTRRTRWPAAAARVVRLAAVPLAVLVEPARRRSANISKAHFTIVFNDGRYWIDEHSSFGTLVRVHDSPTPPPIASAAAPGWPWAGARSCYCRTPTAPTTAPTTSTSSSITRPPATGTVAVFVDPLWYQLLRRLESGRAAHLLGLPWAAASGIWPASS